MSAHRNSYPIKHSHNACSKHLIKGKGKEINQRHVEAQRVKVNNKLNTHANREQHWKEHVTQQSNRKTTTNYDI